MLIKSKRQPILGEYDLGEDELDEEVDEEVEEDENYTVTPSKVGTIVAARSESKFYHTSHGGGGGDHGEQCVNLIIDAGSWTYLNTASFDGSDDSIVLPSPLGLGGALPSAFVVKHLTDLGIPAGKNLTQMKVSFLIKSAGIDPPDGNGFIEALDNFSSADVFTSAFFVNVDGVYVPFDSDWHDISPSFDSGLALKFWFFHNIGFIATYNLKSIQVCVRW